MGIRISEMEEATTFGADDYVPIVTNGTNKKALGAKIKNFIAGFFVSKSGDTMSGDLNINSNNARTKYINPNMTLDTSANNGLSSDSSYGAYFTDKNGNAVGDVSMTTRSTGRNYAQLMARNKKTDGTAVANYIDVIADKDGSSSYFVSNPAAFRKAIDAAGEFQYLRDANGGVQIDLPAEWNVLIIQTVYNGSYLDSIFLSSMMTSTLANVSLGNYGTSYAIGKISKTKFLLSVFNWGGSDVTASSKSYIYYC